METSVVLEPLIEAPVDIPDLPNPEAAVSPLVGDPVEVPAPALEGSVFDPMPEAAVAKANTSPRSRSGALKRFGAGLLILAAAGTAAGCSSSPSASSSAKPRTPASAPNYNPASCTTSSPDGQPATIDLDCVERHFDTDFSPAVRHAIDATVTISMSDSKYKNSTTGIIDGPDQALTVGHLDEELTSCIPAGSKVIARNPAGTGGVTMKFLGLQDGWQPTTNNAPGEPPERSNDPDVAQVFVGGSNKAMSEFDQNPEASIETNAQLESGDITIISSMAPDEARGDMRSWDNGDPTLRQPNVKFGVVISKVPNEQGLYFVADLQSVTPGAPVGTIGGESGAPDINPANGKVEGGEVVGDDTEDGNTAPLTSADVAAVTDVTLTRDGKLVDDLAVSVLQTIPSKMTASSAPCS